MPKQTLFNRVTKKMSAMIFSRLLPLITVSFLLTASIGQAVGQNTIAAQDFDNQSSWSYFSNVNFFQNGWGSDGYFDTIAFSKASPLDNGDLSGTILGENDLDDEGNGTSASADVTFGYVSVANQRNVKLTFDYDIEGYNANSDEVEYEIFHDNNGQGQVILQTGSTSGTDSEGTVTQSIPDNIDSVKLVLTIDNNGVTGYSGFDNFELFSNSKPEPSNQPSAVNTVNASSGTLTIGWDQASGGSTLPDGYLVKASSSGVPSAPVDGNDPAIDADLSDGSAVVKVSHNSAKTSLSRQFSGLSANQQYNFRITSYTNTGSQIDFLTSPSGPTHTAKTEPVGFYYQSYKGQNGKGFSSAGADTSGVNWQISKGSAVSLSSNDFVQVSNEAFQAQDVDGTVTWISDTIDIRNRENLQFSFSARSEGDIESSDQFDVFAEMDGNRKTLYEGTVNSGGDVVFGSNSAQASTTLSPSFQTLTKRFPKKGDQLVIKIEVENNAGTELFAWDNVEVKALGSGKHIPANYYTGIGGLQGQPLKAQLHQATDGHEEYPYTSSNTDVWDILKAADEAPSDSTKVELVYTNQAVNAAQEFNNGNGWSREHVWPQSLGGFNTTLGPGTDLHNLKPSDISTNNSRGNKEFSNGGSAVSGVPGTFSDNDSWEPRDAVKGDLARIIFYMAVRYDGTGSEPDLSLVSKTDGITGKFGNLDTLLKWHQQDPVSAFEQHRNETIYNYQKNRNPFIDSPELARKVWNVRHWQGSAANNYWDSAANWAPGGVPGREDTVILNGQETTGNFTVRVNTSAGHSAVQSLQVQPNSGQQITVKTQNSGTFEVSGDLVIGNNATLSGATSRSGDLQVGGAFTNNGQLQLNNGQHELVLNGSSDQSVKGLSRVNALTVKNPDGVTLQNSLSIVSGGTLTLSNGVVSFANSSDQLAVSDDATVNAASNSSYVRGTVEKTGDDSFSFPVGANGKLAKVSISAPANTTDAFSATYIDQKPGNSRSFASNNPGNGRLAKVSNNRYWDLKRVSGTSSVDVTLHWNSQTNSGIKDTSSLVVAHETSNNEWENLGKDKAGGSATSKGSITRNNVQNFSPFTYGSTSNTNPLPVELTAFEAELENNQVALSWATASETNNKHFIVQKRSGNDWQRIGRVKGHGTSMEAHSYRFRDANVQPRQTYYYRLKQVDFDGSYEYSEIKAVSTEGDRNSGLSLYPNPTADRLYLQLDGSQSRNMDVTIYSAQGQVVYQESVTVRQGDSQQSFAVQQLEPGQYIMQIKSADQVRQQRFIKQ